MIVLWSNNHGATFCNCFIIQVLTDRPANFIKDLRQSRTIGPMLRTQYVKCRDQIHFRPGVITYVGLYNATLSQHCPA